MKEIILKIMTKYRPIEEYFHKYVNRINYIYEINHANAYFESIKGGILWIIHSWEDYQDLARGSHTLLSRLPPLRSYSELMDEIKNELGECGVNPDDHYTCDLEVFNYPPEDVLKILQDFFKDINPEIEIKEEHNQWKMNFPTYDSIVDYLLSIYVSEELIRTNSSKADVKTPIKL